MRPNVENGILSYLNQYGPADMPELRRDGAWPKGTITNALQRLKRAGLVQFNKNIRKWQLNWKQAALDSLARSIDHWNDFAEGATDTGINSQDCACCAVFLYNSCTRCPVKLRTGRIDCHETPWSGARDAKVAYGLGSTEFSAAAKDMRDFLIDTKDLVRKGKVKP